MPAPHIPTPLDQLGHRRFSFYPAIVGVEHNEWLFRCSDWDEIQVMNTKTHQELWIPRRFLGGVSSTEEPVVIVGLVKELEFREGAVVPLVRRVIEMPRAVNDTPRPGGFASSAARLAPVVGIRLESETHPSPGRGLLVKVAAGLLTCIVGLVIFRDGPLSSRARFFTAPARVPLPFTASDDYLSIVSRIGRPASDAARTSPAGLEFHLLRFPDRGYTLVLLGHDRDQATYAGAFGRGGRVIHSVTLPDGADSAALLSRLIGR
ncbi:MAG TPA: hypothetical protein VGR73_22360 [Bryobacteraceae bacterium]|nr:hypothetical protein [Bryobacteraceae bacterium]